MKAYDNSVAELETCFDNTIIVTFYKCKCNLCLYM